MSVNLLGYYLWKRINQDQEHYINKSDLDGYVRDYFNYGVDWDDVSKEEQIHRYWDERDDDVN